MRVARLSIVGWCLWGTVVLGTLAGCRPRTLSDVIPAPQSESAATAKIKYRLAIDDRDATSLAYMAAANRHGIPCAFLIGRDGRLAWIGHPQSLDDPLSELVHTDQVSPQHLELESNDAKLHVGDPAPPLRIEEWLVGEPVNGFTPGQIYVVEFWATWCGPCLKSMPHLNELQAQYADRVTIVGVTRESVSEVQRFLR